MRVGVTVFEGVPVLGTGVGTCVDVGLREGVELVGKDVGTAVQLLVCKLVSVRTF